MPRMLRRAAVLGTTAHVASNRGAAKAQAAQQQQAAATPAPQVPSEPAPPGRDEQYADLLKAKELFDAGALTQAEYDVQKQKILSS